MTPAAAAVLEAAKQLTPDEQIEVIDLLSGNLPHDADEHHRKWSEECRRRTAETDAGVPGVSLGDVRERTRELLEAHGAAARG